MYASFRLDVLMGNDMVEVTEEMLGREWQRYQPYLLEQDAVEGTIVIEADGQPPWAVGDELWAAAQNLCFRAATFVLRHEGDSFLYRRTSAEGVVVVIPEASYVRLVAGDGRALKAPVDTLLPTLFACGERCINLYRRLGGELGFQAEYLQPYADEARRSLLDAGLITP